MGPSANSTLGEEVLRATGKRLAMHIVAAKPKYMGIDDVPEDVLEKSEPCAAGTDGAGQQSGQSKATRNC